MRPFLAPAAFFPLALLGAALGAADAAEDNAKELKQLQGKWTLEAFNDSTQEVLGKLRAVSSLSVEEDGYEKKMLNDHAKGKLVIDATQNPKWIDFVSDDGAGQKKTAKGIYSLKDGVLTLCVADPGEDRPSEFKAGPKRQLEKWKAR